MIVSRGQLVEIGGSFRLPEIFEVSGASLREVGTTNKTRLSDYRARHRPADGRDPAGPSQQLPDRRLYRGRRARGARAAGPRPRDLWMIDDIGSGALGPGRSSARRRRADGRRSDRRRGRPGPVLGRQAPGRPAVRHHGRDRDGRSSRVEGDPLMRAFRLDKMTLAALEATLLLALRSRSSRGTDPALVDDRHAGRGAVGTCREARGDLARSSSGLNAAAVPADSYLGGGSAPVQPIPTVAVAISPPFPAPHDSEAGPGQGLAAGRPAGGGPRPKRACAFDLRTIPEDRDPVLLDAVRKVCHDRRRRAARTGRRTRMTTVDSRG